MRGAPALNLALSLVWVVACKSGDGPGSVSTTTDSAGVTIVTNFGPLWGEGEGWRLDAEPTLDLGGWDATPEYDFGRISDAALATLPAECASLVTLRIRTVHPGNC